MSTYETNRERDLFAIIQERGAFITTLRNRIALLEAVAEAAEAYLATQCENELNWLEDSLCIAGYLKDQPNA